MVAADREHILLTAVALLHQRGFEWLRIRPGLAPSGMYWRCELCVGMADRPSLRFSSASWFASWPSDLIIASPTELADAIVQRESAFVERARGADAAYVSWYATMLSACQGTLFPISYADWDLPPSCWLLGGGAVSKEIAAPPAFAAK